MKKRTKLIIVAIIFFGLGILGSALFGSPDDTSQKHEPAVTHKVQHTKSKSEILKENYDKVKTSYTDDGDNLNKVIELLGQPNGKVVDGDITTYSWKVGNSTILVMFMDGKAVTKEIRGSL